MMKILTRLLEPISSLRLTLICLGAALVLVFAGTLAQVRLGLFIVQEEYFQSWFVYWTSSNGFKVPIFPGGHLVGAVLLTNLIAAHVRRFSWTWKKFGIQLTHFGLIVMLAGGLATDLFSVSSYMHLDIGETKNYSEAHDKVELAVTDVTNPKNAAVTAIPDALLSSGNPITDASLPAFRIEMRGFYRNSQLAPAGPQSGAVPAATNGVGRLLTVNPQPRTTKMDEEDHMSAIVEIFPKDGASLGTWLVSDAYVSPMEAGTEVLPFLAASSNAFEPRKLAPQSFDLAGRKWSLQLRPTRYYKPYSVKLNEFTHELYPGTQIPKDFASTVSIADEANKEHRQVRIWMNHPLRYEGDTYYQSGHKPDDSGTVLQVVRNPSYQAPYAACIIVSLGLIFQFTYHLVGFARRTHAQPPALK